MGKKYKIDSDDMTYLADRIRAKGGTVERLSFPLGMGGAVDAISTGAAPRRVTGTFRVSDYQAFIDCGFVPDIVILKFGTYYDADDDYDYTVDYTFCFPESGQINLCGYVGDQYDFQFVDVYAWTEGNGFTVWMSAHHEDDFSEYDLSRTDIRYIAIKYT